jgi:hypothetical protein
MEVVGDAGVLLSVLLVGHPKLRWPRISSAPSRCSAVPEAFHSLIVTK